MLAAGGTGGHLFPAEALAHEMAARTARLHPLIRVSASSRDIRGANDANLRRARKSSAELHIPAASPASPAAPIAVVSTTSGRSTSGRFPRRESPRSRSRSWWAPRLASFSS